MAFILRFSDDWYICSENDVCHTGKSPKKWNFGAKIAKIIFEALWFSHKQLGAHFDVKIT